MRLIERSNDGIREEGAPPLPQARGVSRARNRHRRQLPTALLFVLAIPFAAQAEDTKPQLSSGFRFTEKTGEELYAGVCQGCHMPDGKGASGAGAYPSLAEDRNLETGGYPVTVVVRGLRGMPPVGALMSDAQVAAVVNYVRTHFGNQYQDAVTTDDVKQARP